MQRGLLSFWLGRLAPQRQMRADHLATVQYDCTCSSETTLVLLARPGVAEINISSPHSWRTAAPVRTVVANTLRQRASHTETASHGDLHQGGVLRRHASSSSCRRLQVASCRAENLAGPSHLWDELTDQLAHMQTGQTRLAVQNSTPLRSCGTPCRARSGVNPRGLAGLCQPSLPPGRPLGVPWAFLGLLCSSSLLSCDLPRQGGREVSPGVLYCVMAYYCGTAIIVQAVSRCCTD